MSEVSKVSLLALTLKSKTLKNLKLSQDLRISSFDIDPCILYLNA